MWSSSERSLSTPADRAQRERGGESEDDESEQRVQAAHPAVLAGKGDLHGADDAQQQGEDEIAPGKPGDERSDEDQYLEPVHREAGRLVGVERALARAEDVGADQVDLHEDAEDD